MPIPNPLLTGHMPGSVNTSSGRTSHSVIYTFEGGHTWHHRFYGPKAQARAEDHGSVFAPFAHIDYCGPTREAPTELIVKAGQPIVEL